MSRGHRHARAWILIAATLGTPWACRKGERQAGTEAGAPAPDPAPTAAAGSADGRQCWVALKQPWGTAVRSSKGPGTREDVIRAARLKACAEIGVVEADCTEDRFVKEYEGCVGDPRGAGPSSPAEAEAAARIRAALAAQADGGTTAPATGAGTPASDAATPPPPPPPGAQIPL